MAGQINWQISFDGIDQNINKLKQLDSLLTNIGRKSGLVNGAGNINVNGGRGGIGGGGVAAGVVGGALASRTNNSLAASSAIPGLLLRTAALRSPVALTPFTTLFGPAGYSIVTSLLSRIPAFGKLLSQLDLTISKYVFTPLSRLLTGKLNNELKGLISSIGARGVNLLRGAMNAFQPGDPNSSAGRAVGAASMIPGLSRLNSIFLRFGAVGVGVAAAFASLLAETYLLTKGIHAASESYITAAKLGKSVSTSNQLQESLKMLGISEQASTQMLLRSELAQQKGKDKGSMGIDGTNSIISTARVSGFGAANELMNMPEEFRKAFADSAKNSKQMEQSAKAGLYLNMEMVAIGREWRTLWAQIAEQAYPVLHLMLTTFKTVLGLMNDFVSNIAGVLKNILTMVSPILKILGYASLIIPTPHGNPGNNISPVGGAGGRSMGAWEKMGFSISTNDPTHYIQETAANTAKTNNILTSILSTLGQGLNSGTARGVGLGISNTLLGLRALPSIP